MGAVAIVSAGFLVAAAPAPPDVTGQWRTQRHGAVVRIADCGDGTPCGALTWVNPAMANGLVRDAHNPDRALRHRQLDGVPILWGFRARGEGWTQGRLYNPDTGQTFHCALRPLSPAALEVTGCLGPLCRSEIWTRIDANPPRRPSP